MDILPLCWYRRDRATLESPGDVLWGWRIPGAFPGSWLASGRAGSKLVFWEKWYMKLLYYA